MINYEELYNALQPMEKSLKDSASAITRLQKAIVKNTDNGNLTEIKKSLAQLSETASGLAKRVEAIEHEVNAFDTKEYFISGDFTRQLLDACEQKNIDVRGEKGIYEMFPYKIRIVADEEHAQEVYMDRKKVPSFRPDFVAETIRSGQEKLYKAKFNPEAFMTELAEAYETTCLKTNARIGSTLKLEKIYKTMVPMARARKEYDKQAYAFDLARIYELGPESWVTKSGQRYFFGSSRDGKSGYRVLSSTGVESYVYTLKPLQEEEQ